MTLLSFGRAHAERLCLVRTLVNALVLGLMSCWVAVGTVSAATFTWGGSGTNGNWGDNTQWAFALAPPTNGFNTDIVMEGSDTSPDIQDIFNNNVDYDIDSITLSSSYTGASTMVLAGGELTVDNEIVNNDTQQLEFDPVIHMGDSFLSIRPNSGEIDFDSALDVMFTGSTIAATGGGNILFDGGISRDFASITDTVLSISGGTFVRIGGSASPIGQVNITDGTLQINSSSNLGGNTNVDVFSGSIFDLNNFNENIDVLTGSGSVDLGSAQLVVGEDASEDASFTFSGVISGTGGITKDKDGEIVLTGSNTYTGLTSIDNGTLRLSGSGRISNSSDVSIFGPATFDLNGISDTVDSIQGAGTIRLGGGILTVDETAGTRTFSGNILESGEMQKNGGGTLVLSGSNTFTLLDINAGTVRVSSQGNLGSGTIELSSGTLNTTASFTNARAINTNSSSAAIDVNTSTTLTQTGTISGTGNIEKEGNGTLAYSAANTYTGDTEINDGTLRLNVSNAISNSSDVIMVSGATLDLNNRTDTVRSLSGTGGSVDTGGSGGRLTVNASSGTFTWGGVISGSGGFTKSGNHTQIISAAQTYTGTTNINDGLLQFTGGGDFSLSSDISVASGATWDLNGLTDQVDSISGGGNILLGGATLLVDENSASTRTFSGVISEAGNFQKIGSHTLVFTGNNTYTGTTTMDAGVLRVGSSSNLGGGSLIFDSGTLNTTGSFTNSRAVSINSGDSATFDVNGGTTLTQTGVFTAGSTTTLVKVGTGTFALNSSNGNNFTGDILVSAGTLQFGSGDTVGNATDVSVSGGATFSITQTEGIDSLSGSGSVTIASGQLLEIGLDNSSSTFSGIISGTNGRFGKAGTGVLTLTNSNTYSGATTITGGTLRLSGSGRLSDSTDVSVSSGATFDINDVTDAIDALTGAGSVLLGAGGANSLTVGSNNGSGTFSGDISEAGGFIKVGAGTQTLSGSNNWTAGTQINGGTLRISSTISNLGNGLIQINGGTLESTATLNNVKSIQLNAGGGTLDVDAGTTFSMFAGTPLTGVGALTKSDTGTLLLTASNTYTGDTNINAGMLVYSGASAQLSDLTDVIVAGGATWDLNGNSDTVKSIAGAGNIVLNGGTLTVNQNGGATTFSGAISDPGGITKEGSHTLTLSGLNDYEGPTTINEGVLQITEDFHLGEPASDLVFGGGTLYLLPGTPMVFDAGRSITLNSGGGPLFGTIFLEAGSELTVPGVISGPGTLDVSSDNEETLILSGVNSYLGGTTIFESVVSVSQNANLGDNSGSVTLNNGGLQTTATFTNQHAVVLDGGGFIDVEAGTLTQSAGISGTGPLGIDGPGTLLLTVPATHAGNTIIAANATLQFGSGELPDNFNVTVAGLWDLNGVSDTIDGLDGEGLVLLGGGTLTVGFADGDGNFCGSIQEAGSFVKTGSGTQILDGSNTYTGSTTIDEGTLEITSDGSLGAASATLVFNEGTLRTASTFTTGRTTTINTIGEFDTVGGATLTFSSPIDGGANADLRKSGTGTLVLTQPSTFGGLTEITEGTLRLTGGGLLANGGVDVFTGATFDTTDVSDTIGRLLGGGDVLLGLGTLTIGADNLGGTFSGVISGVGGAIVKEGTGTQVFDGVNTYTGGTFVNNGVLEISQSENLGALGTLLSFDGGTLHSTATFSMIRGIALEAGGGTIDVDASTTLDASGNITGAGSLTKTGNGDLVLSGFSTYLGGTNVNAGVVEISSAVNLGSTLGTLALDNGTLRTTGNITTGRPATLGPGGGTFEVDSSTTLNRTATIAGSGFLRKTGDGDLTLSAANTFTGPVFVNGGTVHVTASNQLGDDSNLLTNFLSLDGGTLNAGGSFANDRFVFVSDVGGTIDINGGNSITQFGVIRDLSVQPGAFTKSGGGLLTLTAANTYTGPTSIAAGIVRLSGSGRLSNLTDVDVSSGATFDLNGVIDAIDALSGTGDVLLGAGTLIVGSDDGGATFSGVIGGTGSLTKTGTGTQQLRTKTVGEDTFPNTYTGGTTINGGALDIEHDENLGDPTGTLSFNSGTLQLQGDNTINTTRAVTLDAGGGTLNPIGEDSSMTFGGVIGGSGALTKIGLGRLTLTASNTYGGNTSVLGGILRLSGAGQLPDTSSVVVEASGIMGEGFDLNNISDAVDGISGAGDIHLGSGTLTIGSANGSDEFDGTIDGTGGLVKVGSGAQIINGANTYTGGTAINGGALEINADNRLGDPAGSLSFDGGTLATGGTFSMARATTLNAGGGTLNIFAADTLTHTAVISGTGGLAKSSSGTLILSGINTYTGPTNVTGGTLQLGGIERLANQTTVSVSAGADFNLNNFNESIDALSGAGSVQLGTAQLVVGLDNGSGTFSGVISGTGDLLKEGTGTQTLTGANTYSGATFVDRGELVLSGGGSISQATLVTGFNIGADGTTTVDGASTTWDLSGNLFVGFDGTGQMNITDGATVTVDGDVTIGGNGVGGTLSLDDGTLDNSVGNGITVTTGALQGQGTVISNVFNQDTVAPGNSAGILTLTGNYSQDVTGLLSIEIGGSDNSDPLNPEFDLLDISGTAGLAGQLELALISGVTPAQVDTFTILSASALAGVFSNVADGARLNIVSGGTGSFQVDYTASSVVLSDFQGVGGSIQGDFNGDNDVDGFDFLAWQRGESPNPLSQSDLNDWEANYGTTPSLAAATSVPEPTALLLGLMFALLAFGGRRSL